MSTPVPPPTWDCTKSPRWQALLDSARAGRKIKDMFAADAQRFQKYVATATRRPQHYFISHCLFVTIDQVFEIRR